LTLYAQNRVKLSSKGYNTPSKRVLFITIPCIILAVTYAIYEVYTIHITLSTKKSVYKAPLTNKHHPKKNLGNNSIQLHPNHALEKHDALISCPPCDRIIPEGYKDTKLWYIAFGVSDEHLAAIRCVRLCSLSISQEPTGQGFESLPSYPSEEEVLERTMMEAELADL
jgi:hypothetical protein